MPKVPNDDNPFLRQLELMLSKSASNHAAASSSNTTGSSKGLTSGSEAWPLSRPLAEAASGRATVGGTSRASVDGGGDGGSLPRSWKRVEAVGSFASPSGLPSTTGSARGRSATQPKTNNGHVARPPQRRHASVFDGMGSSDSSIDDGTSGRMSGGDTISASSAGVSAARALRSSPSVAEPKADVGLLSWGGAAGGNHGGHGSDSSGPSSDGGWPETKRCPPPNLLVSASRSNEAVSGDFAIDGDYGSMSRNKTSPPSTRGGKAAADRPGITGGRPHSGARIAGLSPAPAEAKRDGLTAAGHNASLGETRKSRGSGVINDRSYSDTGDNDWMSDADDGGPAVTSSAAAPSEPPTGRVASSHSGLKRRRAPPARSTGDDGSGDSSGYNCRGGKAGRSERYPTPVPRRRRRSSSLSLSPRRFTAFDSDYDSDEDPDRPPDVPGVARRKGTGSASDQGLSTNHRRGGRGHKRQHEELLNDRIGAMRVGSDGEEHCNGGTRSSRGGGGLRVGCNGRNEKDPMGALY